VPVIEKKPQFFLFGVPPINAKLFDSRLTTVEHKPRIDLSKLPLLTLSGSLN